MKNFREEIYRPAAICMFYLFVRIDSSICIHELIKNMDSLIGKTYCTALETFEEQIIACTEIYIIFLFDVHNAGEKTGEWWYELTVKDNNLPSNNNILLKCYTRRTN